MDINRKILESVKNDIVKRTGRSGCNIVLKYAKAVTWPDTSLGCPLPDRTYAQVITPGYRLVLSDGTTDFEYHTDNYQRIAIYDCIKNQE